MGLLNFRFTPAAKRFASCLAAACMACAQAGAQTAPKAASQDGITFSGAGSISFGRIVKSSDTTSIDYNGNSIRSIGAQFLMKARYGDHLRVSAGMGVAERHYLAGQINNSGGRTPYLMYPYLVNSDISYIWRESEEATLKVTGGYFPYSYNPDVKNLGLYLLRGPVYPGILISGFETRHTAPVANNLGIRIQHVSGPFEQNLIVNSETESYPLFDVSPAYIAGVRVGEALKIGAGVNFHHIIPIERKLTSPDTFAYNGSDTPFETNVDPNDRTWIYVDTAAGDTTFLSFAGTKVMAFASFDPKALFGTGALGPEDLKIYGEAALIGLDMSKAYREIYGGYMQRMPIMVGFNLPMFEALDHLSLEVQWYGAKFRDDLSRYQATTGGYMSPLPKVNSPKVNTQRDDWKWSLHGSKKLGQVRMSFQVANDHTRPGGTLSSHANEWQALFIAPKDWYWMAKLGFFF